MKIIKILISMTLLNAFVVMGIVKYASTRPAPAIPAHIQSVSNDPVQTVAPVVSKPQAPKATIAPKPTAKPTSSTSPTKTPTTTPTPTSTPSVATPTPTAKPAGCVIQIDGVKYNITSLVQTHSGGNVFTCGTDMSAIFWGRHNAKILQIMQQYKI